MRKPGANTRIPVEFGQRRLLFKTRDLRENSQWIVLETSLLNHILLGLIGIGLKDGT
jgi:hypothetical protein